MTTSSRAELTDFLDRIDDAVEDLEVQLSALRLAMGETRALLERDVPLAQALAHSRCPAARGATGTAAEALIDLLHDYRAETIRRLVDEEGWSITEIAKRSGNARQVIARLYHSAQKADTAASGGRGRLRSRPRPKVRMTHPDG